MSVIVNLIPLHASQNSVFIAHLLIKQKRSPVSDLFYASKKVVNNSVGVLGILRNLPAADDNEFAYK